MFQSFCEVKDLTNRQTASVQKHRCMKKKDMTLKWCPLNNEMFLSGERCFRINNNFPGEEASEKLSKIILKKGLHTK